MKIKVVVHEAEEGGFWAEVPALPGCATQGDDIDALMRNLREAIEASLTPAYRSRHTAHKKSVRAVEGFIFSTL